MGKVEEVLAAAQQMTEWTPEVQQTGCSVRRTSK